jgi:membrane-associated protease RseP (regulator of RpoE activity)
MFWSWREEVAFTDPAVAWGALTYTGALAAVILSHEFAHYLVAVRHGWRLSLPYLIPNPFAFGTFGAVISLEGEPPDRVALLEMAAAGPIAGALVSFALMAVGLHWTGPDALPSSEKVISVLNDPPAMDLLARWLVGSVPGRYAELHPMALAGWVGCLITGMNLVPLGQTDGGHIVNALWPRRALVISRVAVAALVLAGLAWPGWAVWAGIALIFGFWRGLPVPVEPGLTARARWLALAAFLVGALSFMPVPVEDERWARPHQRQPAAERPLPLVDSH